MYNNLKLIIKVWKCLSSKRKKSLVFLNFFMIITSISEAISIGAVLPFLSILTSPEKIFKNSFISPYLDFFKLDSPSDLLLPITLIFALTIFLAGSSRMFLLWFQTKLSWSIGGDLAVNAYERILYQSYSTHISKNSSEIIEGSVKARDLIGSIIQPTLNIVGSIIIILAVISILLTVNTKITLISFIGISAIYLFLLKATKVIVTKNSKIIANQQVHLTKAIQEGLGNIRDVLIHGNQETYKNIYQNSFDKFKNSSIANQIITRSPRYIIETLGILLIITLAYILTYQDLLSTKNLNSDETFLSAVPILGTIALGAQRLLPLAQQIFASFSTISSNSASINDALELLYLPIPKKKFSNSSQLVFKKSIFLKDISFKYSENGDWVLKNINLEIPKGSKVGFIGKTGSGKSTLLDIIMALIPPTSGSLLIDGVKVNYNNSFLWQANISHVPQDIFMADTTILENIALGIPVNQIDLNRVYKVAKDAKISNQIEKFTKKYKTYIGERGVRLSGGQKQRIGIARAIYKKSSVIVFDEATSALDLDTEALVMNSIKNFDEKLTVLIAAHRKSTLNFCDFIINLDKGIISKVIKK